MHIILPVDCDKVVGLIYVNDSLLFNRGQYPKKRDRSQVPVGKAKILQKICWVHEEDVKATLESPWLFY
jgi:hypothetical protein